MKSFLTVLLVLFLFSCSSEKKDVDYDFTSPFEKSQGTESATYAEVIEFYTQLAENYKSIKMYTHGKYRQWKTITSNHI